MKSQNPPETAERRTLEGRGGRPPGGPQPREAERKQYTCPMHPEVVQDQPGRCPKCGMELVPADVAAKQDGHGEMPQDHVEMNRQMRRPRLWTNFTVIT